MKKYLLLIISMVCAVTGAWADLPSGLTVEDNGSTKITYLNGDDNASLDVTCASGVSANIDAVLRAKETTDGKAENTYSTTDITVLHVTGAITAADLTYIHGNMSRLKLLDLSGATLDGVTIDNIEAALLGDWNLMRDIALIIPTPSEGVSDITTGQTTMYAYQQKSFKTVAYYADPETKNMLNIYATNESMASLSSVVTTNTYITMLPGYTSTGDVNTEGYSNPTNLTSATVLGNIPAKGIDMTFVYYSDNNCDYSNLNANTHYIVVPQGAFNYSEKYDFTTETETSAYKYNDNIWVVSTYKAPASPYAQATCYGGTTLSAYLSSASILGNDATRTGETINVTYLRKTGELGNAYNILPNYIKSAERTILLNKSEQTPNATDITQINSITSPTLDLSNLDLTDEQLNSLANTNTQYLAIPYNSSKELSTYKTNCTALKGLATFNTSTNGLYMQSYEMGSMWEVMTCLKKVTSNSIQNLYAAGPMCARDLANASNYFDSHGHFIMDDNGSLSSTGAATIGGESINGALTGKINSDFYTIDISGVTLPNDSENSSAAHQYPDGTYQDDLGMGQLGFAKAKTNILLPTDASVWRIPSSSLNSASKFALTAFCIPGQYKEIGQNAFSSDNCLTRVYTTKADGTIYDLGNGGHTITLPPALTKIETGAFSNVEHFTDVYVTSPIVPICQIDAFGAGTYTGWGGLRTETGNPGEKKTADRDNYGHDTASGSEKCFAILHWTGFFTIDDVKKFTDIERNYSYPDDGKYLDSNNTIQQGEIAKDDRGNILMWPSLQQLNRAYSLASYGYLEGAWDDEQYNTRGNIGTQETADSYWTSNGSPEGETFDMNYAGWHQFVLVGSYSLASERYVVMNPDNWYTICIPYDVTYNQFVEMFGVDAHSETSISTLVNSQGFPIKNNSTYNTDAEGIYQGTEKLLPKLSTLTHVTRTLNTSGSTKSGQVTLYFTQDLVAMSTNTEGEGSTNKVYKWQLNETSTELGDYAVVGDGGDQIIMEANKPYHICPYVPLAYNSGAGMKSYTINYLKENNVSRSNAGVSAWVVPVTSVSETETLKNAKNGFNTYQFIGTYEDNANLPVYSYFLYIIKSGTEDGTDTSSSLWYRYLSDWDGGTPGSWGFGQWAKYSAIIQGVHESDGTNHSDLIRDNNNEIVQSPFLVIDSFSNDSETTGISYISNTNNINPNKVYNLNGQVVNLDGKLNTLPKGVYIMNGKKIFVK